MQITLEDIYDDFSVLDDWEEKYRYIIDLGKKLAPLPQSEKIEANLVRGCASQVWLTHTLNPDQTLHFAADSDAHIVKGLVFVVVLMFDNKTPAQILATDAKAILANLGLNDHLSSQRANGLASMVQKIQQLATQHA